MSKPVKPVFGVLRLLIVMLCFPAAAQAQERMNFGSEGKVFGAACYQFLHGKPEEAVLANAGYAVKKRKRKSTIYKKVVGPRGKRNHSEVQLGLDFSKTRYCRLDGWTASPAGANAAVAGLISQFEAGGYQSSSGSGYFGQGATYLKSSSVTFKASATYHQQGGILAVIVARER